MKTTLQIADRLLAELKAVVPERSRSEGVRLTLAAFVRPCKREKLRRLRGRLRIEDAGREMEAAERPDVPHRRR